MRTLNIEGIVTSSVVCPLSFISSLLSRRQFTDLRWEVVRPNLILLRKKGEHRITRERLQRAAAENAERAERQEFDRQAAEQYARQCQEEAWRREEEARQAHERREAAERAKQAVDEHARRFQEEAKQRANEAEQARLRVMQSDQEKREAEEHARRFREEAERQEHEAQKAREDLRRGACPDVWPTLEQFESTKMRYGYTPDMVHIAVAGISGCGKSSLVNSFRGLSRKDAGAARTGIVETTMEVARYPRPRRVQAHHLV